MYRVDDTGPERQWCRLFLPVAHENRDVLDVFKSYKKITYNARIAMKVTSM